MEKLSNKIKAGPGGKSVIQFATEIHNKLPAIHPFVDGNGRTARLLLNTVLLGAHLPPVILNFHDNQRYLDCLEASNHGDISSSVVLVLLALFALIWLGTAFPIAMFLRAIYGRAALICFLVPWALFGLMMVVRPNWILRVNRAVEKELERVGENLEKRPPPGFP